MSVYVIDTGIYKDHADFGTRARFGRNTVDENDYAADCSGHGTHVAGTIGGTAHGVAKNVSLFGVQVLGCLSGGTVTDVVQGVDWVTANAVRPAVANMSIGGRPSDVLTAAVNASVDAGITYVAAAGNENANACDSAPAGIPRVITVAASTEWDARRFDSNHGSCVDLFTPGDQITSAWISDKTATKTIGGTSMAAPHVAGAAAQYLAKAPDAAPAEVAASLVRDATTGRLSDIGSGSPNRLVHRVIEPVVRYLSCESALNTITCESAAAGALVPGVRWKRNGVVVPAWDNNLYVTDPCSTGATVRYDVTVTELYSSSHSVSTHVTCRSGPRP